MTLFKRKKIELTAFETVMIEMTIFAPDDNRGLEIKNRMALQKCGQMV